MGATILPIMVGDDDCGPFVVLSYVEPTDEQMPLSFAHAHASDNWRISVRGTTNMGRDTYEQGQFRFHDGGVPYASDNFAWGPDGGYGIIMFADRRGFAIQPVKAEIAAKVAPEQAAAGAFLGIDMQDPVPRRPGDRHDDGPDDPRPPRRWLRHVRARGTRSPPASAWPPASPASRPAGRCSCSSTAPPACEAVPARSIGTETIVAPVSGSVEAAGATLAQGDVRVEEADVEHPALVAGARRRAARGDLRRPARAALALDDGTLAGPLGAALSTVLAKLQAQLPLAGSA